ncbi:MAG: HAD-IIA family hydrolase [Anaerolineae bacterium]|nr:HAD-IIA family hydrolase [Anaerolineae bacterium]
MSGFDIFSLEGLIFDIDGTLVRGGQPLPGLNDLFTFLRQQGIAYTVASNNSTKTPQQYYTRLQSWGADIPLENILTSALATARFLRERFPAGDTIFMLGQQGLRQALLEAGYNVIEDFSQKAQAAVIGGDYDLTYNKLKHAILHIQHGALFIGTNPDIVFPTEEGLVPECGTTLAAIQAATGIAPIVIGKPQPLLFEMALQRMASKPQYTAIVGDRLDSDILGGKRLGIGTILVKTGVDSETTVEKKGIQPDLILKDLQDLLKRLQGS